MSLLGRPKGAYRTAQPEGAPVILRAWRSLLLACLATGITAAGAQEVNAHRARLHYLQHCVGCHLVDGSGAPDKGIPSMRGLLADFAHMPGGRDYIVQVPGVMNSPLNDRDIAELMNWLVPEMGTTNTRGSMPAYTADEIARLRRTRPADVVSVRQRLMAQMPTSR